MRPIPAQCVALVRQEEGCVLKPYLDANGHLTIGTGHKITPEETFNGSITLAESDALLAADLAVAGLAVEHFVHVYLSDNQFSALVSFVFNEGSGSFATSTLLNLLNKGQYAEAAKHFAEWNKITRHGQKVVCDALVRRRERERQLFLKSA